jgi:CRP/FNR family cyclic AMP-dependent transcriptional regulator
MPPDHSHNALDFLGLLRPEQRGALEQRGRRKQFAPGAVLMHEGLAGDIVLVLFGGVVKVTSVTEAGSEVVLGFCGPGELVGELSVLDREPRSSNVTAMEAVEALLLSSREFLAFLDDEPDAARAMLEILVRRFRDSDRRVVEFGASDALGRVASRLVELSDDYGRRSDRGLEITLALSQDELASWAGCSKKSLVISLQTLRRLRCIETARRSITVLDIEALRARAASP